MSIEYAMNTWSVEGDLFHLDTIKNVPLEMTGSSSYTSLYIDRPVRTTWILDLSKNYKCHIQRLLRTVNIPFCPSDKKHVLLHLLQTMPNKPVPWY